MSSVLCSLAVSAILAASALASAAGAASERVTSIFDEPKGDTFNDGYVFLYGDTRLEMVDGRMPVVEWAGKRAVKLQATHSPGGFFNGGFARRGWMRFFLDDYGPDATFEVDVAGSVTGTLDVEIVDTDPDEGGPEQSRAARVSLLDYVQVGPQWQTAAVPLRDFLQVRPDLRLGSMSKVVVIGAAPSGSTTVYLANMRFRTRGPERAYPPVKVDHVGYRADRPKSAKVTPTHRPADDARFVVKAADTGDKVFDGRLELRAENDESSGDVVYDADFSALRTPGVYVVDVPGVGESPPFRIADGVYDGLLRDAVRFYYFQRCGMALAPETAGPCAHRACHTADRSVADLRGGTRDVSGGWHDAGDMNRYAGWLWHAVGMPLLLYAHYPDRFADGQFDLPESGNGVPDLLDELKYELQWERKMLIREGADAGAVYDRLHQDGVAQPQPVEFWDVRRSLREPTDEAACSFVTVLSLAHAVYRGVSSEREFAEACLADAQLAWDRLQRSGRPDQQQLFSAAAALFEATGRPDVHDVLKRTSESVLSEWNGHVNYRSFDVGLAVYCLSKRPEVDADLQARLRRYYKQWADDVVRAAGAGGYGEPLVPGVVFTWGSNALIAKSGAHLLIVNRFAPDPAYVETAEGTLHWLLGRNAVAQCMVTGYGTPPLGPIYHSMFGPLGPGLPMPPGYVPGGVNRIDADGVSAWPAKCWRADHTCWQLTEPSIGYQGSFVYLVGALAAGD